MKSDFYMYPLPAPLNHGMRFIPGGAYPFFKFPKNKLFNKVVETDWMKNELKEFYLCAFIITAHKIILTDKM